MFLSEDQKQARIVLALSESAARLVRQLRDTENQNMSHTLSSSAAIPASSAEGANASLTNNNSTTLSPLLQGSMPSEKDLEAVVNVTKEYPFEYATIMFGYIMPFVLVITIITNSMVVMVLAQRHMRTPTNIVLFTMAIVDLFTLLSPSPWYFYFYTLGHYDKFLYPPVACYAHHYMTDVIPVFFHTSSIWLALLLASQRWIYVCHPTLARTWCTVPRVRKAIITILCVAFLHQASRFFDNKFTGVEVAINNQRIEACRYEIAEWVNKIDIALYYTTYFTFRILFVFVIPCFALTILNFLLFKALKQAEVKRTELLKPKFKLADGKYRYRDRSSAPHQDCSSHAYNKCLNHHRNHHSQYDNTTIGREMSSCAIQAVPDSSHKQRQTHQGNYFLMKGLSPSPVTDKIEERTNRAATGRCMSTVSENDGCAPMKGDSRSNSLRQPKEFRSKASLHNSRSSLDEKHSEEGNHENNVMEDEEAEEASTKNSDDSHVDIVSICPDCASYVPEDASGDVCARCSALLIDTTDKISVGTTTATYARDEAGASRQVARAADYQRRRHPHHQHSQFQHQATTSQCSSLMGPVTQTTTNDDLSSCMATNNNVSGSQLAHEATLDATIDVEDDDDDDEEAAQQSIGQAHDGSSPDVGNCSGRKSSLKDQHSCNLAEGQNLAGSGKQVKKLTKNSSMDSHLGCGCKAPSVAREMRCAQERQQRYAACHHRYAPTNAFEPGNCSQDSQYNNNNNNNNNNPTSTNQRASNSASSSADVGDQRDCSVGDSGASSNSCIDCDQNRSASSSSKGEKKWIGKGIFGLSGRRRFLKSPASQRASSVDSLNRKLHEDQTAAGAGQLSNAEPRCQTDDMGKSQELTELDHVVAASMATATTAANNTNTTTTTTTTLYSNNTNSINSLLQASSALQAQTGEEDCARKAHKQQLVERTFATTKFEQPSSSGSAAISSNVSRMKSPSFASSTGRGSRATLLGATGICASTGNSSALPVVVSASSMVTASSTPASMRTMDSNRTTLMLIVVVTVFLAVELPVAIVTIMHVMLNLFDVFKDIQSTIDYIKLFTNFFIAISYSVNFSIYCSMSKKFRETFRDLFFCGRRRKRKFARKMMQHRINHDAESIQNTRFTSTYNHQQQSQPDETTKTRANPCQTTTSQQIIDGRSAQTDKNLRTNQKYLGQTQMSTRTCTNQGESLADRSNLQFKSVTLSKSHEASQTGISQEYDL